MKRLLPLVLSLFALVLAVILLWRGPSNETQETDEMLTIAFAEGLSDFSPFSEELQNRRWWIQIYEPLLRFDENLQLKTSLAVSWGQRSSTLWEFKLREGVQFHDGSTLRVEDVIFSLKQAGLSNVESLEKVDAWRFQVQLKEADALFLNRLTQVFIVPNEFKEGDTPNGTGPYRVREWSAQEMILEAFDEHWKKQSYFKTLNLVSIPDAEERASQFKEGRVDVLVPAPPQIWQDSELSGEVKRIPSLELSMLLIDLNQRLNFEQKEELVSKLNEVDLRLLAEGLLIETEQLLPKGILGYQKLEAAPPRGQGVALPRLRLLLPQGLESLGERLGKEVELEISYVAARDYEDTLNQEQKPDLALFTWKYELADASPFFEEVIHRPEANYGSFHFWSESPFSRELDQRIEGLNTEALPKARNDAMSLISEEVLGTYNVFPLFESQWPLAFQEDLFWEPRLDTMIYASEIFKTVL